MRDFDIPLRRAYFNALNGNIEVDSIDVPVVDSKLEQGKTETDIYIMVANQNTQENNNKCSFRVNSEISLDIVHRMKGAGQKRLVDLVSDQILTVLFPTRKTHTLEMEAGFRLYTPKLSSTNTTGLIQLEGSNNFMIVKTLVFSNIIIQ